MTKGQQTTLEILAKRSGRTLEDVTELWEERAAIREYEAGWKRREAERQAIDDVAEEVMRISRLAASDSDDHARSRE